MSSKRHLKRKMCGDKIRHSTLDQAQRVIKAMRARGAAYLEPYKCRWCGSFHIGHHAPRRTP